MKILLVALNAKYVHTNLAIHYLQAAVPEEKILLREFTINEAKELIISSLYQEQADVLAFSCYIWNIEKVLAISSTLKKVSPQITIILGGPEVSYETEKLLQDHPFLDFIVMGEGELVMKSLLQYLRKQELNLADIPGLAFKEKKEVKINPRVSADFDWTTLPSPFLNRELGDYYQGKILYYETSRGCPFTCSYCLSGRQKVQFLPLERVKKELVLLADSGAKQIKFVDRTFNSQKKRALEIWQYILDLKEGLNYHFEISADLLDEESIRFLKTVPAGLFNFEIGIQTTHPETMEAIYRKSQVEQVLAMIERLLDETGVIVYLDLIVGLPYETFEKFHLSFDRVLALKPHKLHLGFLKVLKGSKIKEEVELHGYKYDDQPPYEILANKYLHFGELIFLHRIEELLERYYNSGRFRKSHQFIDRFVYSSFFAFYSDLAQFWLKRGLFKRTVSLQECYEQIYEFFQQVKPEWLKDFRQVLKFDYLSGNMKGNLPSWCEYFYSKEDRARQACLVNHPLILEKLLPHLKDLSRKERVNVTHSDYFSLDLSGKEFSSQKTLVIFDYSKESSPENSYLVVPKELAAQIEEGG